MNGTQKPKDDSLLKAFEQSWLHARHAENERLWFTNIYAILLGGLIVYTGNDSILKYPLFITLFFLTLTLLGLVLTIRVNAEFKKHMDNIRKIVNELNLSGFMRVPKSKAGKLIRVGNVFLGFYIIMSMIWFYILFETTIHS